MSFYYITRADARHELYDHDQSLLMGWQAILPDLPVSYNCHLSAFDTYIWNFWCSQIQSERIRTFQGLFVNIACKYEVAVTHPLESISPALKQLLTIVYRQMKHDHDTFKGLKMDDSTLWDLDHNNRRLTRAFQTAKLLCPLNQSAEAVAERFRRFVQALRCAMDEHLRAVQQENPLVADDGSVPVKQEIPDEGEVEAFIPTKKQHFM